MNIPKLDSAGRTDSNLRHYNSRTKAEKAAIIFQWLFRDDMSHRNIDKACLGLDPKISLGYASMGVLHYLGLKKPFKGLFKGLTVEDAITTMRDHDQNFDVIVSYLESDSLSIEEAVLDTLLSDGKQRDPSFESHYETALSRLASTDYIGGSSVSRREQGLLRARLFGDNSEAQCAICHKVLPTDLLVAAHIKPRSKCSYSERTNPNVVMPVCKIGCDDFFERGYVLVTLNGEVCINDKANILPDLQDTLTTIDGNACTYFNADTKDFFACKLDSSKQ